MFIQYYNKAYIQYVLNYYQEAYDFIKMAKPYITDKEEQLKYYQLFYKILSALKYNHKAYKIAEKIALGPFDWHVTNNALDTISNYIKSINTNSVKKMKLSSLTPEFFNISSISIMKKESGYRCNFRAINYDYTVNGDFIPRHSDGVVRTKNYLIDLDSNFLIQQMSEIKEAVDFDIYPCRILGMEDVRLFGNYFLCTRLDATLDHQPKVCLGDFHGMKVLNYGNMGTEKNWLPLYDNGKCQIIYSFDPFVVYDLNLETGELTPFMNKKLNDLNLSSFRGSAVPIKYKEGWLMTIHQVYYHKKRRYFHRLVWLNNDFTEIKYSKLYYHEHIGVEFNLGICLCDEGVILTYSVDEKNSTLTIIDYDTIDSMIGF